MPKSKEKLVQNFKGQYTVVQLCDIHLTKNNFNNALEELKLILDHTKPDLAVMTGDNLEDLNEKEAYLQLNEMFQSFNVLWAVILGNHDGEYTKTPREQIIHYCSNLSHCITPYNTNGDRFGDFILKLFANNSLVAEIIGLDSGDYLYPRFKFRERYDTITKNQTKWVDENSSSASKFVFMHIPIKEFEMAYKSIKEEQYIYGKVRENKTPAGKKKIFAIAIGGAHKKSDFFTKLNNGSLKAIFVGHDHVNDAHFKYENVDLIYGQKTCYTSYNNLTKGFSDNMGVTILKIFENDQYEISRVFQKDM